MQEDKKRDERVNVKNFFSKEHVRQRVMMWHALAFGGIALAFRDDQQAQRVQLLGNDLAQGFSATIKMWKW